MTRSTLEGVAALTKQLNALGSLEEGKALKAAVRAGIKPALELARENIPVGNKPHRLKNGLLVNAGYAKSQIAVRVSINSAKNLASARLGVLGDAFYAVQFVELGTRKMAAEPWLRRSLLDARSDCEEAFRASIAASVIKAAQVK